MKIYVVVLKGYYIYEKAFLNREDAENFIAPMNDDYHNYVQNCIDNYEPYSDIGEYEIIEEEIK